MIDVRQGLFGAGEALPTAIREQIVASGRDAVAALLEILADRALWNEGAPGDGWAPIHAAKLLGELRAPEAALPLLAAFSETDWEDVLKDRTLQALHAIGLPALEPALSAFAAAADDERRDELCGVLSGLGVRDERVLPILLAQLARDACAGAMNLASYGDPRALSALLEALDSHKVQLDGLLRDGALIEFDGAVRTLGGELRPAHVAKLELM